MKIPFDNAEQFFCHSALHFLQMGINGSKVSRVEYVKRLAQHSKRLKSNQCPRVAEFCKTIRMYGKKGLWVYDQYCQMILGSKPISDCHPLSLDIIIEYAKTAYTNKEDRKHFIDLRTKQCLPDSVPTFPSKLLPVLPQT